MSIWRFAVDEKDVRFGERRRRKITRNGCNEPYKDRYWCPKKEWFNCEPCPFLCQRECENFTLMCGGVL
jgi:hypothetical protein